MPTAFRLTVDGAVAWQGTGQDADLEECDRHDVKRWIKAEKATAAAYDEDEDDPPEVVLTLEIGHAGGWWVRAVRGREDVTDDLLGYVNHDSEAADAIAVVVEEAHASEAEARAAASELAALLADWFADWAAGE